MTTATSTKTTRDFIEKGRRERSAVFHAALHRIFILVGKSLRQP